MTTFLDGPAKGQNLALKASPEILRVVQDIETGEWDALDQPGDKPRSEEQVFNYVLVECHGTMHLNAGKRSGFYKISIYKFVP